MPAPNLELVPLDRCAGHALIAGSVQVGRRMRFTQCASPSQAAAAWQALMAPAGRDDRARCERWADVPPVWNRPSCQATARVDIGTHRHHCTAQPAARRVPRGRGGRCGATCAAAAAQLAVEHGARRRAQLRPAPLPLCSLPFSGSAVPAHAPARRARRRILH